MENPETDCRAVLAKLYLYLDGEMAGEGCSAIEAHFRICEGCLRRAGFEREFKYVIATRCRQGRAPEEVLVRLRRAIESFEP